MSKTNEDPTVVIKSKYITRYSRSPKYQYKPADVSKLFAPCYYPAPMGQQPPSPVDTNSSEIHAPDFNPIK